MLALDLKIRPSKERTTLTSAIKTNCVWVCVSVRVCVLSMSVSVCMCVCLPGAGARTPKGLHLQTARDLPE